MRRTFVSILLLLLFAATVLLDVRGARAPAFISVSHSIVIVVRDGSLTWFGGATQAEFELWRLAGILLLASGSILFWRALHTVGGLGVLALIIHAAPILLDQPLAFPFVFLFDALWIGAIVTTLLRRKRPAGMCVVCGYDLRATPGRCPECGTPVRSTATVP